ncbi:Aste57867_20061 [Aphanomyces stellatus]|uniref:Aste57867_20061 protein n=1 Tax=Aphanomyces stellatus TaxID=120398 RepID=A0A485LET1_9STRA|nr:hypothetical protein As57867_019995 [Aphanomyces stellatus]VFT96757.1 Aste57867_20061 [Aphanomyces stellatus]
MIAPYDGERSQTLPLVQSFSRRERLEAFGGMAYLVITISLSVWFLHLLDPSLSNNLYWSHYNVTGYGGLLIDLVNLRLSMARNGSMDATAPDLIVHKSYGQSLSVPLTFQPAYARQVLFTELNTLDRAIRDLRNTTRAYDVYGQYCWLDFQRRWDVAHTAGRSTRCAQQYKDNAATYVETLVRNVDWTVFMALAGDMWHIAVEFELQQTPDGVQWLADRPTDNQRLSVDAEVALLQSIHLVRYDLLWHNKFVVAITETMMVENALGISQSMTLKASSASIGPWTSVILFWNFHNDLYMCEYFNASLIRSAANSFDNLARPVASIIGVQGIDSTYGEQVGVLYDTIGPFESIDTFVVAVPGPLLAWVTAFRSVLYQRLWTEPRFRDQFESAASVTLTPMPPTFARPGLSYNGGNILCLYNPATSFPQTMISFDDSCTTQIQFSLVASNEALLFALYASGANQIRSICAIQSAPSCIAALTQAQLALSQKVDTWPPTNMISPAVASAPPLQFVQYAQNASGNWLLLQQPLLTSDPNWSFFGWLAIYDWVQGTREVLRLEGDAATVVLISEAYANIQLVSRSDLSGGIRDTQMVYYLLVVVTTIFGFVACVVLGYVVCDSFCATARNLFVFNRVVGSIWIGRPLLLLRGLTATLLLSTSQVQLMTHAGGYSKFEFAPRPLVATMVVAGESTWVTYVISDVLLVWTGGFPNWTAALASGLAWLVVLVVEITSPVVLTTTLNRQCTVQNVDKILTCQSGAVQVGAWQRIVLLVLVHGGCIWLSLLVAGTFAYKRRSHSPERTSLMLHGSAQAFLKSRHPAARGMWQLDSAACVMSGMIPFTFHGQNMVFDMNLWVIIPESNVATRVGSVVVFKPSAFGCANVSQLAQGTFSSSCQPTQQHTCWSYLKVFVGFGYIGLTAIGSVSYIDLSSVNFANNFYWATFNMTGHHVAIANWFNEQLSLGRNLSHIRLDEPQWSTTDVNFSDPAIQVKWNVYLPPRLQFEPLSALPPIVQGLRTTDPCSIPWVFTQYCWVDFQRLWPVANTAARQLRCQNDISNGAVYLEPALRNTNWDTWTSCWGTSFGIAFGHELQLSKVGRKWLASVQTNVNSIVDEVTYWHNAGIQHYTVQWQNYKTTGLINTYMIENAFGVQYPMTLSHSNGSYRLASQTTFPMYWGLANDLWAVSQNASLVSGQSLIRTSSSYAFANTSMFALLAQNGTITAPIGAAYALVQQTIGPFGSIDMKNIPCPTSVKYFVATGLDVLRRTLTTNEAAARAYDNISASSLDTLKAFPSNFLALSKWLACGCDILCPESMFGDYVYDGMTKRTGRTTACGQYVMTLLRPTKLKAIVAAIASGLNSPTVNLSAVCVHEARPIDCETEYMTSIAALIQEMIPPREVSDLQTLATVATTDVWALQATIFQYVQENASFPLQMLQYALFDPADPTFFFWAWLHVMEWAMGEREVVRFEGDAGHVHLVTEAQPLIGQDAQPYELPTTFALYARSGVQYITGLLLATATGISIFILSNQGCVEAANLLEINRVAGIVWVGRPLLLLRGITALCLLSTGTLELHLMNNIVSLFQVVEVPWYKTILGAGEVTWLVYILNDVLMVCTKEYTALYASSSSLLTWFLAAILTLALPVTHHATIDPSCQIDQIDLQLVCTSGVVVIGHVSRLYWLLGIVSATNVVCYAAVRVLKRRDDVATATGHSLLLSAGANYLFARSDWLHHNVYYIDPASALMNGLVSFRSRQTIYVMDIKLWRAFAVPRDSNTSLPTRLHAAIGLTE